jgi:hypothetical protein
MKPTSTRGKRDALSHPSLTAEDALDDLRNSAYEEVRKLAQESDRDAVRTLVELMENRKIAPAVRRQCARDLLEIAHGKSADAAAAAAAAQAGGGLTINILKLSGGDEPATPGSIEAEVIDTVQQAVKDLPVGKVPAEDPAGGDGRTVGGTPAPAGRTPDWSPS